MTTTKSPARIALEDAHLKAAAACGQLALILSTGRGLTPHMLAQIADRFEIVAGDLRSIPLPTRTDAK